MDLILIADGKEKVLESNLQYETAFAQAVNFLTETHKNLVSSVNDEFDWILQNTKETKVHDANNHFKVIFKYGDANCNFGDGELLIK